MTMDYRGVSYVVPDRMGAIPGALSIGTADVD